MGGGEAPACRAELISSDDVMAASNNTTTSPESEDITSDEVWMVAKFQNIRILFVRNISEHSHFVREKSFGTFTFCSVEFMSYGTTVNEFARNGLRNFLV